MRVCCVCVVHLVHGEFSSGIFRKAFMLVDTDNMNLVLHDTLRSENSKRVIGNHITSKCGSVLCHLFKLICRIFALQSIPCAFI